MFSVVANRDGGFVIITPPDRDAIHTKEIAKEIKNESISEVSFEESQRATANDFDQILDAAACNGGIDTILIQSEHNLYRTWNEDIAPLSRESEFMKSINAAKLCFFANKYMRTVSLVGLFLTHDAIVEIARILAINSSFLEEFSVTEKDHTMRLVEDVVSEFERSGSIKIIRCRPTRSVEFSKESLEKIYTSARKIPTLKRLCFTDNLRSLENYLLDERGFRCNDQLERMTRVFLSCKKYNANYELFRYCDLRWVEISSVTMRPIKPYPNIYFDEAVCEREWSFKKIQPRYTNERSTLLADFRRCYGGRTSQFLGLIADCISLRFRDIDFTNEKLLDFVLTFRHVRKLCFINCAIESCKDDGDFNHVGF